MNQTRKEIVNNFLKFVLGLAVMAIGTYMVIQANIGVSAWDCLAIGLGKRFGLLYGNASMIVSITVVCIDLIMKEKIGLGTIVNAIIYGKFVDLYTYIGFCPVINGKLWLSCIVVAVAMFFEATGVVIYMSTALGCGPRDTFKVGIGRHFPRVKIGYVGIGINAIVLFSGWLLGGPVGMGTVIEVVGYGFVENIVNGVWKFEPRKLRHQDVVETFGILTGAKRRKKS